MAVAAGLFSEKQPEVAYALNPGRLCLLISEGSARTVRTCGTRVMCSGTRVMCTSESIAA